MKPTLTLPTALLLAPMVALNAADELASRFTQPPAEAKPWVYWYWMNGNVTREGIRADMQAFADVGVGGALTFDIGIHPAGTVTNRSREWYELVKLATAEAARHGIKMGFHCPGWSASGGPWITPELGMQELTWSETIVEGPREFGRELTKQAVAYYHVDSYEAGWQNWTAKFPQEFRTRRGYDLLKYLPTVTGRVVGDVATTEKFLWDFRRAIGDLFADNHYGRLARRCRDDGIEFSTEPYGGAFEFLQVGTRADHPMVEFWLPTNPQGRRKIAFPGVFAGHTTGRRIIGAEAFTSGPPEEKWNSHPFSLKALGDFIYCCGINRFVIHVSAHQPLVGDRFRPGFTCGCNGIHFDRGNTWWEHGAKEWATYLARCQALLQTGEHVADVLYFQGNDSPDGVGPFAPPLQDGCDYDACNAEVLDQLRVKDGDVVLPHGKSYRFLVLPRDGHVTLASLRKIASLAKDGARIVGTLPKESPSLADAAAL